MMWVLWGLQLAPWRTRVDVQPLEQRVPSCTILQSPPAREGCAEEECSGSWNRAGLPSRQPGRVGRMPEGPTQARALGWSV